MDKRNAFTLAEVLITLGIIGVVVALTMPSLIQNHRKHVVETRLKKFYSNINQAVKLAEVDYGDKKAWTVPDPDNKTFFETFLKPYLQYTDIQDITGPTEGRMQQIYLPDGSLFTINLTGSEITFFPEAKNYKPELLREFGSKSFRFGFWPAETSDERFIMHINKGVEPYMANWDGQDPEYLYSDVLGCNATGNGSFCTSIIARNGWKIPDNYPKKF